MAIAHELARRCSEATGSLQRSLPESKVFAGLVTVLGAFLVLVAKDLRPASVNFGRVELLSILLGLLVVVAAFPRSRALLAGFAILATWLFVHALYALSKGIHLGPPVAEAVGGAAYYDSPYVPAQLASMLALAGVLAVAAAVAWRHRPEAQPVMERAEAAARALTRRGGLGVAAAVVLVVLTLQPDLGKNVFEGSRTPLAPDWDVENLVVWESLVQHGLEPVKDFFYPYGEAASIFKTLPLGPAWQWVAQGVMLALAAWSLWRLSGGGAVRVILCLVVAAVLLTWTPALSRYLPGLLVATTYAAVGPARHRRLTRGHAIFGFSALFAAWLELDLLLFGLAGAACVLAGEVVAGRVRGRPSDLARRLAIDAAPLLVVVLVPLWWLADGSWAENTRFWLGLRAASAASAPDQDVYGVLLDQTLVPSTKMLGAGIAALVFAAGLALGRLRGAAGGSEVLLAAAGATQILVLKDLARIAADLPLILPWLALLWAAILVWDCRKTVLAGVVGALFGMSFVAMQQLRVASNYVTAAATIPTRLIDNLQLAGQKPAIEQAKRDRYAPARFAGWPENAIAGELRSVLAGSPEKSFAVLGDAAILYTLFDEAPPYHIELYDASRIEEQRAVVSDLKRRRPAFLVWRRDIYLDGVPQQVRTPLIFDYAIRNYVPVRQTPGFDILAKRGGKAAQPAFWQARFGDIDLGYVPAASHAGGGDTCARGPQCVPVAVLRGRAQRADQKVRLRVTGAEGAFAAIVHVRPGVQEYPVRVDRLWFWPFLGPRPRIEAEAPGWTVELKRRRAGDELW
jgi:hypothetical protein